METRGLWWNIHDFPHYKEIFYILFFISVLFFIYGFYLKIKVWSRGKPKNNFQNIPKRILTMFEKSFLHKGWKKTGKHGNSVVIISHILVFITAYYYTNKFIKLNIFKFFFKPIIASLTMILILYLINLTVIPAIILGGLIYVIIMFSIKGLSLAEIKELIKHEI